MIVGNGRPTSSRAGHPSSRSAAVLTRTMRWAPSAASTASARPSSIRRKSRPVNVAPRESGHSLGLRSTPGAGPLRPSPDSATSGPSSGYPPARIGTIPTPHAHLLYESPAALDRLPSASYNFEQFD